MCIQNHIYKLNTYQTHRTKYQLLVVDYAEEKGFQIFCSNQEEEENPFSFQRKELNDNVFHLATKPTYPCTCINHPFLDVADKLLEKFPD